MALGAVFILIALATLSRAQEWGFYGGDPGGARYSPMKDINRENVTRLRPAWIFHTGDISDGTRWVTRSAFESTPLVVDGILYVTTPFSRVIALDSETGKELWSFDPRLDRTMAENLFINRGVAHYSNGKEHRIFLGSLDGRLFSLSAETGKPDERFGVGGWVDLREGIAESYPGRNVGMTSPPVVFEDLVICGSLVPDGDAHGPSGAVRAYNVRSGRLVWTFHTVAQPGEAGNETWAAGSWKDRGGANAWPPMSVDRQRGIVFLPLTSPSTDYYGGDRKGQGLYGDALVALDARTGKRLWHFQTVHHNLWDYDLPAQPTLVQVRKDGRLIDAVAQVTKTGFTFVFNRVTGEPLFPIEESPAPKSEIPGEESWPTQPKPLKPPPYARQGMTADELTDVTPETRAYCARLIADAVFGPIFTPIGFKPTVLFPGTNGGANWGGASFDPETRTLFVNSMDVGMLYHMTPRPEGSGVPFRVQGSGTVNSRLWDPDLIPCQKPPFGFLTAIDLDRGTFRWRSVLGVIDNLVARGLPPTGAPNIGGSLVTGGGLVFIGATNDSRFRAFDKDTGKELWTTRLPASAHASPMTFRGRRSGRQYIVVAAGGGNKYNKVFSDALIAFALPAGADDTPLVSYSRNSGRESVANRPAAAAAIGRGIYSHARHASSGMDCAACHKSATTGERAGFPRTSECLRCHLGAAQNSDLQRLSAMPASAEVEPDMAVYRLPDFVYFRHNRHAETRIACATCHGDVSKQDPIRPVLQMKMAACVDCHKASKAALSCTACHELSR
jgi:glucose dehydrogenase